MRVCDICVYLYRSQYVITRFKHQTFMKFLYLCLCIIALSVSSGFAQQNGERDTIFPGKSYRNFFLGVDDSASVTNKIKIQKIVYTKGKNVVCGVWDTTSHI